MIYLRNGSYSLPCMIIILSFSIIELVIYMLGDIALKEVKTDHEHVKITPKLMAGD